MKYLIEEWNNTFFSLPLEEVLRIYTRRMKGYLGSVREDNIRRITNLHNLGYLPLEIWALPEGSNVNLRVPMFVMHNSKPELVDELMFGWITNNLETILSTTLWLPCTTATTALMYRKLFNQWAEITNSAMIEFVLWQGHDFSFRGHGSFESAKTSGAAHLLSFFGTDTVPAIDFLEEYYNADCEKELIGGSVAATEHSVMCVGGIEDEVGTFKRLITETYPTGIVSIVSDTWDFYNIINPDGGICATIKEQIMARDGKTVIRPDSGDPVKIVTGDIQKKKSFVKTVRFMKSIIELEKNGEQVNTLKRAKNLLNLKSRA